MAVYIRIWVGVRIGLGKAQGTGSGAPRWSTESYSVLQSAGATPSSSVLCAHSLTTSTNPQAQTQTPGIDTLPHALWHIPSLHYYSTTTLGGVPLLICCTRAFVSLCLEQKETLAAPAVPTSLVLLVLSLICPARVRLSSRQLSPS